MKNQKVNNFIGNLFSVKNLMIALKSFGASIVANLSVFPMWIIVGLIINNGFMVVGSILSLLTSIIAILLYSFYVNKWFGWK